MLRECHRVLRPGGRVCFLTIHPRDGLSPKKRARALELGPPDIATTAPLSELLQRAGFTEIERVDVTSEFGRTCEEILGYRADHETGLRNAEGDEEFEAQLDKKSRLAQGVREGVLERSLFTAAKL